MDHVASLDLMFDVTLTEKKQFRLYCHHEVALSSVFLDINSEIHFHLAHAYLHRQRIVSIWSFNHSARRTATSIQLSNRLKMLRYDSH